MKNNYNIEITHSINFNELISKYNLASSTFVTLSIGYDQSVYLLFSAKVPERIKGMFVNTIANTEYRAICIWVDWTDASILGDELIEFGIQKMNFHFIQPIKDKILLLGARTMQYQNGEIEQNAVFFTRQGKKISETCFGDGIEDCIVMEDGRIITSYFDEGVFGNFGWDQPIGSSGLIMWNKSGNIVWKNTKYTILDCYAMNLDERNHLWFYYYDDFQLVDTDFRKDRVYQPDIEGSTSFLIMKSHQGIIMDGGYGKHIHLKMLKLLGNHLGNPVDINVLYQEQKLQIEQYWFRSAKAVFLDKQYQLYFVEII